MSYAVVDVETTIYKKGHPFSARNKLCLVGIRINGQRHIFKIEYDSEPYGPQLDTIRSLLADIDLIVGFNLKFDIAWLRRYGIILNHHRVFDCQLVEFILGHQQPKYPSLNYCLAKYNLGVKLDVVDSEYWSLGIDTPDIPLEVLVPYLEEDLRLTDDLYQTLVSVLETLPSMQSLVNLGNADLLVLLEMEFNGIKFDWEGLDTAANKAEAELFQIDQQLLEKWIPQDARQGFNFNSNDHCSALLYGGDISYKIGTPYQHQFKTGPRAGQIETRSKWEVIRVSFTRLVDPLPKSELAKEGFWSTDEPTLRQLPKPKPLISLLLRRSEISKWISTYCKGIPAKREDFDWSDGLVHGQFNQCVAITGRLSSSNPNQQNFPKEINEYIITRF